MLTTESRAGREGEVGVGRLSQTFLEKNKGKFQHLEHHLGARPDVLAPTSGLSRERVLFCCPAPKQEGGSGWGQSPRAHSASTALLNVTPAAHSKSLYALYELATFLKCPNAFLSLPSKPSGVPTTDPASRGAFSALD